MPDRSPIPVRTSSRIIRWGLEDDSVDTLHLPNDFRFTWLQAAIRSQAESYRDTQRSPFFIEMIVFYEKIMTERVEGRWQSILADKSIIPSVSCVMETAEGTYRTAATRRRLQDFVEHVQCDLAPELERQLGLNATAASVDRLSVTLQLHLSGTKHTVDMTKDLVPFNVERPAPGSVGICLPPVWGDLELGELLEWREWHRLLGVQTVHWYARGGPLELVTASYNKETGAKDTFRRARPLTPEAFQTNSDARDLLEANGMSHDQTIQFADCKLRSTYRNPTEWLAYTDLDEFFILKNTPLEGRKQALAQYFARLPGNVGSVRFFRTLPGLPRVEIDEELGTDGLQGLAESDAWTERYYGALGTYTLPTPGHSQFESNTKFVHRVSAVYGSSIHDGLELYPGMVVKEEADGKVMLAHPGAQLFSDDNVGPFENEMPRTAGWLRLNAVWAHNKLALAHRLLCQATISGCGKAPSKWD